MSLGFTGRARPTRRAQKIPPCGGIESVSFRAGDRTRTGDVQLGKLAFYQLNYARESQQSDREPQVRIELTTARLRIGCSTPELLWPRCPGADSNRYALRHHPLKMACLPISPPGQLLLHSSPRETLQKTAKLQKSTGPTGLEPATSRVTVECSNQTELRPQLWSQGRKPFLTTHLPLSGAGCQSARLK